MGAANPFYGYVKVELSRPDGEFAARKLRRQDLLRIALTGRA
jgi:hypothetical protein